MIIKLTFETVDQLVADVARGIMLVPQFQRGYVWPAERVSELFDSLYRGYPVGNLLVWETYQVPQARPMLHGTDPSSEYWFRLLLDGQQRIASLASILLDRPIGDQHTDVAFNVFTEEFAVSTDRLQGRSEWVSLRQLFAGGPDYVTTVLEQNGLEASEPVAQDVQSRLWTIFRIRSYQLPVSILGQANFEEVSDIFVRVNSGRVKVSAVDLVVVQISAKWDGILDVIEQTRRRLSDRGWRALTDELLLTALTALVTGQPRSERLFSEERQALTVKDLQAAWHRLDSAIDRTVAFLESECFIDRPNLLHTFDILIPLVIFFDQYGAQPPADEVRNLRRWTYLALMWARYQVGRDQRLDRLEADVQLLSQGSPLSLLSENILADLGRRSVDEHDLSGDADGAPFLLMSYILARQAAAKDWFTDVDISNDERINSRPIFCEKVLIPKYGPEDSKQLARQVANLVFVSSQSESEMADRPPATFMAAVPRSRLRMQNVPLEPSLQGVNAVEIFLTKRQKLLAAGINQLLDSLADEPVAAPETDETALKRLIGAVEGQFRTLIAARLTRARGELAWTQCIPREVRSAAEKRIESQLRRHPYEADGFQSISGKLNHCQFSDYRKIIKAQWAEFDDVFSNQQEFDKHFDAVLDARNAGAHDRAFNRTALLLAQAGLIWLEECMRYSAMHEFDAKELHEKG